MEFSAKRGGGGSRSFGETPKKNSIFFMPSLTCSIVDGWMDGCALRFVGVNPLQVGSGSTMVPSENIWTGIQFTGNVPMFYAFGRSASVLAVPLPFLYFTSPTTGGPLTMTIRVQAL